MTQDTDARKEQRTPSDYTHGAAQRMGNAYRHVQYGGDDDLDWLGVVLWILVVALAIGGLLAAWIGIKPWVMIVGGLVKGLEMKLSPSSTDGQIMSWLFVAFLKSIAPFIQWGLAGLAVFIAWKNGGLNSVLFVIGLIVVAALGGLQLATGLLLWAIVQVLILQWILFGFDRVAMRGTLIEMQQFSGQQSKGRGRAERDIFKKLSQTPTAWLKWSGILGIAAVAVDLWVNVVAYPPVKDGKIESFMSAISLGRWAQIDWAAIFQILISMTMFEAAIIFIVVVKQWIDKRELGKTA